MGATRLATRAYIPVLVVGAGIWLASWSRSAESPIRFVFQPVGFTLDSCETPERHAPETMAGGVAFFDYNHDGYPDISFANSADIRTLKKTTPK
jgi:enediyne biosynthesis protein E4